MRSDGLRPWQEECYFGKHVCLVPAEFAYGYQYRPYVAYADLNAVERAIHAEGTVEPVSAFDRPAPQLMMWFRTRTKRKWYRRNVKRQWRMRKRDGS